MVFFKIIYNVNSFRIDRPTFILTFWEKQVFLFLFLFIKYVPRVSHPYVTCFLPTSHSCPFYVLSFTFLCIVWVCLCLFWTLIRALCDVCQYPGCVLSVLYLCPIRSSLDPVCVLSVSVLDTSLYTFVSHLCPVCVLSVPPLGPFCVLFVTCLWYVWILSDVSFPCTECLYPARILSVSFLVRPSVSCLCCVFVLFLSRLYFVCLS